MSVQFLGFLVYIFNRRGIMQMGNGYTYLQREYYSWMVWIVPLTSHECSAKTTQVHNKTFSHRGEKSRDASGMKFTFTVNDIHIFYLWGKRTFVKRTGDHVVVLCFFKLSFYRMYITSFSVVDINVNTNFYLNNSGSCFCIFFSWNAV